MLSSFSEWILIENFQHYYCTEPLLCPNILGGSYRDGVVRLVVPSLKDAKDAEMTLQYAPLFASTITTDT